MIENKLHQLVILAGEVGTYVLYSRILLKRLWIIFSIRFTLIRNLLYEERVQNAMAHVHATYM